MNHTKSLYGSASRTMMRIVTASVMLAPVIASGADGKPVAGEVQEGSLKGKTLTFVSYGGIFQDGQIEALKAFVAKSGARLLSDGPTEIAKLQAQVQSKNVTWDVVDTADFAPFVHCGTLFQKLDFSKLDISNIPSGQVGECSVPAMNYGTIIMYNTEKYKDNPPKGWKDFFDTEKFPGIRAIDGSGDPIAGLIEQAVIAAGGDVSNLTPQAIDQGIDRIRALGPDTIFWKTGAESQQLAESGEADLIIMWTGRAMTAVKNGARYSPVWNDWLVVMDHLTIPVGARDPDASYALINAYLGKEAQETLTEKTSYSPINAKAQPKVDELTATFLVSTPERAKTGYQHNIPFWVKHYESAVGKWSELLAGN